MSNAHLIKWENASGEPVLACVSIETVFDGWRQVFKRSRGGDFKKEEEFKPRIKRKKNSRMSSAYSPKEERLTGTSC